MAHRCSQLVVAAALLTGAAAGGACKGKAGQEPVPSIQRESDDVVKPSNGPAPQEPGTERDRTTPAATTPPALAGAPEHRRLEAGGDAGASAGIGDDSETDSEGTAEPKDAAGCVTACIRDNQMRAVSPEQIERDCRAECAP